MSRRFFITSEQFDAAYRTLRGAHVVHGETAEVEMAIGARPNDSGHGIHFMFCSAWTHKLRTVEPASILDAKKPIDGHVGFDHIQRLGRKLGIQRPSIVYARATVTTNGHVVYSLQPSTVQIVEVPREKRKSLVSWRGRSLARHALGLYGVAT
jgi:hypothetical protein